MSFFSNDYTRIRKKRADRNCKGSGAEMNIAGGTDWHAGERLL